jgi:hypothetical protein
VSSKRQELLTFREHQSSLDSWWGSVLLIVLVFCVLFCFVYLRSVSCVPNIFNVSGLSILVVPSVFSNVYMSIAKKKKHLRVKQYLKRFALFDLLKSLYSDTKILSKYIPSLQRR